MNSQSIDTFTVSDSSTIVAGTLSLDVANSSHITAVSGAITAGGNLGIGAAISINSLRGDTKALIEASRIQTTEHKLKPIKQWISRPHRRSRGDFRRGNRGTISLNDIEGDVSASLNDSNGSFAITSGGSVKLKAKTTLTCQHMVVRAEPPQESTTENGGATGGTAGAWALGFLSTHTRGPYQPESFALKLLRLPQ